MAEPVRHPLFARVYRRMGDTPEIESHRERLLAGLSGSVIEVGAGDGRNFARYPAEVEHVLAVEPEPYLRERAQEAAGSAPVPVTVVEGVAGLLPAEDASRDVAIVSLVLCSVPDQAVALAEIHRVLRPGGELRFYEHVLSPEPGFARYQRIADRTFWPRLAGGCHAARDTAGSIETAGFAIESCDRFPVMPCRIPMPAAPHILGVARRRS
ncbi:MAG: class I SAM-dependent methyltransferase [Thermoleophilaceae bacterium]